MSDIWEERSEALKAKLAGAPAMSVAKEAEWQVWRETNQNPYGSCVIRFVENWARLMQLEMSSGQELEDVAHKASQEADAEGITGAMYVAAVCVLVSCWEHGERLRRWHNLDVDPGRKGKAANESGGILNPTLLSF